MSVSPAVRGVRAAVFAALCVTLAAAGHGLAADDMPPLWADGAGFAGTLALGCLLAGRERSLPGITGAMLAVQAALHAAFGAALPVMPTDHHHVAHPHPADPRGAAAHLAVALAVSWWLRRGEAACWSLLRRRAAALVPGLAAWWLARRVPPALPTARPAPAAPRSVRRVLLRQPVSRRGPPPDRPSWALRVSRV